MLFDAHTAMVNEGMVYRRQEPTLRRCDCCDRCMHVERYHEELYSIEEVIAAGWLVPNA